MIKKLIVLFTLLLTSITVFAQNEFEIEGNVLLKYNGTATYVDIPSEVTIIGEKAFYGNKALRKLMLHGRITEIEAEAFKKCESLSSVKGMANIIGDSAFAECGALKEIPQLSVAERIGNSAFLNCGLITDIELGENLTAIGDNAFKGCAGIRKLKFPHNTEVIGTGAFAECKGLQDIEFEEYENKGITEIGESAFLNCIALNELKTPKTLRIIKPYAFSKTGISRAEINCDEIDEYAFADCANLKYVRFGEEVSKINAYAFLNNIALEDTLINDFTIVDDTAFQNCPYRGLNSVLQKPNEALIKAYKLWMNYK